jgi:hypothetical protein
LVPKERCNPGPEQVRESDGSGIAEQHAGVICC